MADDSSKDDAGILDYVSARLEEAIEYMRLRMQETEPWLTRLGVSVANGEMSADEAIRIAREKFGVSDD